MITLVYEHFREKIISLQSDLANLKVEFLDRDDFKKFGDSLESNLGVWNNICVTGYFSETIRKSLENLIKGQSKKVRLICPKVNTNSSRDKKNLQALTKLAKAGAEVKINVRVHARIFLAYNLFEEHPFKKNSGLLIIGTFDFNTEGLGRERYDAGIKTRNPDLINSAVEFFEQIWNDPESIHLKEFLKK